MASSGHPSDSQAQRDAEKWIFQQIQREVAVPLEANPRIALPGAGCSMRPDFYSEEPPVAGEIFAHVGALRAGQTHKLATDILKLTLLDKATGRSYRKIIGICDPAVERYLHGDSWLAGCVREFGIEVIYVPLDGAEIERLQEAQRRQTMVNPRIE